jgi:hypothetical protein
MNSTNTAAQYLAAGEPVTKLAMNRTVDNDVMTISCYDNEIPAFVEAELSRIYGNFYSSLLKFRSDGNDCVSSTYIVHLGERLITVFLFQQDGGKVRVLNQVIQIDEEDITRFTNYIFARFASSAVISFEYVQVNLQRLSGIYQRFNVSENIVLRLPDSAEKYLASLGKNLRTAIHRYRKKIQKDYPSFGFEILVKDQINAQTIRDIVDLNRARMLGKNKVSSMGDVETEKNIRLAMQCGFVGVARINGTVCAGCITFQVGSNYFMTVLAHDPAYDDYRLGKLCCYLTITECIAHKGEEFHFLWGEYQYKYSFLGVKQDLDSISIYRSYSHFFLNGGFVLRTTIRGYIRQAKLWFHKSKREDKMISRFAVTSLQYMRRMQQSLSSAFVVRKNEK